LGWRPRRADCDRGEPASLPITGTRIPTLDGIRGLAIGFVLVYHFTFYGGRRSELLGERLYWTVALVGWIGVDLLFMLSGFLIAGILYDTRSSRRNLRSFYFRRVLRIFPL
jgi:peptidoglycan/LPS O-acetylase OafA/YrhL